MSTDPTLPPLLPGETRRYSRHLILPEVSEEGQRRLKAARVLLVGAGGLGSPLALYLAAAGVGTLGVVDSDAVDETNLHRQVLHGDADVGSPKTESASRAILRANPHVRVETHETRLTSANALEILAPYDVVADGSDNFPTRYLVNDACVLLGKPDVYGSVHRFEGQVSVFAAPGGPCYRCLYPEPPPPGLVPSCAEAGVLGVLPGTVGLLQATEVMKWLLGIGEPLVGRLLLYDALAVGFRELKLAKDPLCPVCGEQPTIRELVDYDAFCGGTGGGALEGFAAAASGAAPAVHHAGALDAHDPSITPRELQQRLDQDEDLLLLDVREPFEHRIGTLPGALCIPLQQLPSRLSEIDRARTVVVYCHHGLRSAAAVRFLRDAGFPSALNLSGGIDVWAVTVDPGMARY
ncbi:MAG: molybdopterin-synthase adenylyltransferase MoeB [Candidatus Eisenbacteria bacterium]|nr:molybdopterin-synthase adenylyltransferase MoeB [Candidatus Eisenbacteria bacterium]